MILSITGKVGDFLNGETVTGETSEATGIAVTKNEPVSLLCSGKTNPSNIISPYFSAIYYDYETHDPLEGICLNNVQGTFQDDEKVIGQTSGAYAYVFSGVYYDTYTYTSVDPDQVEKYGEACDNGVSCVDAWDDYQADPKYRTHYYSSKMIIGQYCSYTYPPGCGGFGYLAHGIMLYPNFDTSGADANPTSALLRFYIDNYGDLGGLGSSVTVRIYQQDWSTLDTGDWTGGILENSVSLSVSDEGTWIEVSVDSTRVNIGGASKYRIALKETEDDTIPSPNGWSGVGIEITAMQLKLGYNE